MKTKKTERRLSVLLLLPFLGVITALGMAASALIYYGGKNSTQEMTQNVVEQLTHRVEQNTRDHLAQAQLVAQTVTSAITSDQVNPIDQASLERLFWQTKAIADSASYVYLGRSNGDFIGVESNLEQPATSFVRMRNEQTGENWRAYLAAMPGDRSVAAANRLTTYDPRQRIWYKLAVEKQTPVWSEVYKSASKESLVLTYSLPVVRANGSIDSVVGVDIRLDAVSKFMQSLTVSAHGVVFVVDEKGHVLGSSSRAVDRYTDEKGQLLKGNQLSDLRIVAASKVLTEQLGDASSLALKSAWTVDSGDLFIAARPLSIKNGPRWAVVVAIPKADLLAPVMRITNMMGIAALIALCLSLLIGYFVLRWVTDDLTQLSNAAIAVADGRWPIDLPVERKDEIGHLARAFESMAKRLNSNLHELTSRNRILQGHHSELAAQVLEEERRVSERTEALYEQTQARQRAEQDAFGFEQVVEQSSDAIAVFNFNGVMTYSNMAFEMLLANDFEMPSRSVLEQMLIEPLAEMRELKRITSQPSDNMGNSLTHPQPALEKIFRKIYPFKTNGRQIIYLDVQANPIRDPAGKVVSFMLTVRDASAAERSRATLEQTIRIDTLTGLFNRDALQSEIDHLSTRSHSVMGGDYPFAVLFIDIDGFKGINDVFGHTIGDQFLKAVGLAIRNSLRDTDFAARVGGDEFVAVLPGVEHSNASRAIANKIIEAVSQAHLLAALPRQVTCSVGIAHFSKATRAGLNLVKAADQAMYEAKRRGKNQVAIYGGEQNGGLVSLL